MPFYDERVSKKCGLFKYNCRRCLVAMVFNYPIIVPLSPIVSKCDNTHPGGCFEISKFRQFAALLTVALLILISTFYIYHLPILCELDTGICLQVITQILYSTIGITILIYGHVKPTKSIEVLVEWCDILKNNQIILNYSELIKKNISYLLVLIVMPLVTGVSSYMVLRYQGYATIKSISLVLCLQLQLAAMFRHAMVMAFIQKIYLAFGKEVKNILEKREKQGFHQIEPSTTIKDFEKSLHNIRLYYSTLASSVMLITKNSSGKLLLWLMCVVIILGMNIYNLVVACGEGFKSTEDMAIPFETYGLISLILYIIKCVQDLSDVVSNHSCLLYCFSMY